MRDEQFPALPESLADLVRLIGWDAARKLTKRFGGVRLYVPKTMKPEHEIAALIGLEAAEKLSKAYGGEHGPSLPKSDAMMRLMRDEEIRRRRAQHSARVLALEYELTESMIYLICGEMEPMASPQMDLIGG